MPEKTTCMRNLSSPAIFVIVLVAFLSSVLLGGVGFAQNLAQELGETQQDVANKKKIIRQLSLKERALHKDLAKIENELGKLEKDLDRQEKKEAELEKQRLRAYQTYLDLAGKMGREQGSLTRLMRQLWPVYLEQSRRRTGENWVEADQKFTWMQYFYRHSEKKFAELSRRSEAVAQSLQELEQLRIRIDRQQKTIAASKKDLQARKSRFAAQVKKVRSKKISQQEELDQIVRVLESLEHKMRATGSGQISGQKGLLPWPVKGRVKFGYNMKASPPCKGVGFSTEPFAAVRAVAAGQVVHNDTLRGFGRVVILFHDQSYYSLYAFLSEAAVKNEQNVKQGETLGKCGVYPAVGGHGLYFELRFQQKTINPQAWFVHGP